MLPQRVDSPLAWDIARAMIDGFDRHCRLSRTESQQRARHRFETADWHGQQRAQRERIEIYDRRPELVDTFFDSVTPGIPHRNEPAAAPTCRASCPTRETLRDTIVRIVDGFQLRRAFEDLRRVKARR